ncbi:peptidase S8/S53 domain-containing protein [Syncephalis fuscata]|nr:peptidase S8/S53 domain-containing protein [Syncephalis fuscata]
MLPQQCLEAADPHAPHSRITGKLVYVTPYYVPTGVKALHANGIKGKGVKLGIIDSGINSNTDAFEGNYNYNHGLVSINYSQAKHPSKCNRRGVSLAGIAVAKTNYFIGVAPEATLGTYRVFSCTDPTSTSLVLKAITIAIRQDQMKIVVLPEIAIVDEYSTKLKETIEDAAKHGVIMIVAASANNFINPNYFSYQGLPVLSVGGFKQKYRLSHWFEEKTTGRRIEFNSPCSDMSYDFNKEMNIIPRNIKSRLEEHLTELKREDIALVWLIIVNNPYQKRQKCDMPLFDISEKDAIFIEEEKYGYIEDGSVTVDTAGPQNEPFIPPFYPDILAPSHEIYTITTRKTISKPHFSDISAAVAYVAGAAALIAEIDNKSLVDVNHARTILQNSAVPVKVNTKSVHVEPSLINLEDTYTNAVDVLIKLSPLSDTSASNTSSGKHVIATVSLPGSIDLRLNQISEINIKISVPRNIQNGEIWSYSGYIVIDPNPGINGSPSNHAVYVPYYGTVRG